MSNNRQIGYLILKIKLFWNEGYDVIISVQDVTNKNSLRESNYIVDMLSCGQSLVTLAFLWENLS